MLLLPVAADGAVNGVLELGLPGTPDARSEQLFDLVADDIGTSLAAARYREQLQDVLAETQQLNEELQVQQEELRTANEELEEQSRALRASQAMLENQQAELEQTNSQLSERTEALDQRNTALRRVQRDLEDRADELQRASRYKSEFLANMSHELRTPLNSALILAKLLGDNPQGNLSLEQVKFAESIYASGNDLLVLINDILDIAKVEAGKLELVPEEVPLDKLAQSLESTFRPLATDKNLEFRLELRPDAPALLVTDRQRVEQILKNLLSNAIKFTERGEVALTVSATADGGAAFAVHDSGIGIDPQQHELIFEAFRQADGTTSRRYGGTGLGLSISRDLTQLLGGSLTVKSEAGQGSTFTLQLPPRAPQTSPAPATPVGTLRSVSTSSSSHAPAVLSPPPLAPLLLRPWCRPRASRTTARFRATRCAACWSSRTSRSSPTSCTTWRTSWATAAWWRTARPTASSWPRSSCPTRSCWTCACPTAPAWTCCKSSRTRRTRATSRSTWSRPPTTRRPQRCTWAPSASR